MFFQTVVADVRGNWLFSLLSTEWVDYVEEAMKCQALKPHFFSVVDGWRVIGVGGGGVGVVGSHDTPIMGSIRCPPMLFFDNLVKNDQIVKI